MIVLMLTLAVLNGLPTTAPDPAPSSWPEQAPTSQALPQVDFTVEVVGNLPLQAKVNDLTQLLGRRSATRSFNRAYPPTILELITLINRNPEKPRDKAWDSIMALTLRFDEATRMVSVEYCVDRCGFDPRTAALDQKRRMVTYRAPEDAVVKKLDQKRRELAKYAAR